MAARRNRLSQLAWPWWPIDLRDFALQTIQTSRLVFGGIKARKSKAPRTRWSIALSESGHCDRSDSALLAGIRARDQQALEELCRRYQRLLFQAALTILRRAELAEEVVQWVFVKFWYEPPLKVCSPKAYLYKMVKNRATDELRAQKRRSELAQRAALNTQDKSTPWPPNDSALFRMVARKYIEAIRRDDPIAAAIIEDKADKPDLTYEELSERHSVYPMFAFRRVQNFADYIRREWGDYGMRSGD